MSKGDGIPSLCLPMDEQNSTHMAARSHQQVAENLSQGWQFTFDKIGKRRES